VRALGREAVLGVYLPYRTSSPDSLTDAAAVAAGLGIRAERR
jgi:NH3-dependent NAD+ synthetase